MFQLPSPSDGSALTYHDFDLVWKRRKDLLYLGSVHGADLPELYGITDDHLCADAISMPISSSSISSRPLMGVRQSISSTVGTPTTRRAPRPRAYCQTSLGPSIHSTVRRCFYSVTTPPRSIPLPPTPIGRMLSLQSSNYCWLWDCEYILPFSKWILFSCCGSRMRDAIYLLCTLDAILVPPQGPSPDLSYRVSPSSDVYPTTRLQILISQVISSF